jgi:CTP synthase (UTP-ammonia lyase)
LDLLEVVRHDGTMTLPGTPLPPRLALVGDRSSSVRAHDKIPTLITALATGSQEALEPYWLHSTTIDSPEDLAGFDGIWVVPGSPYEHRDGVLCAIEKARTSGIPLLGTCGGFQHLLLEFARNVCGLAAAENAEQHPDAPELLIVALRCSLLGEEAEVVIEPGTVAARAMGAGTSTERFFCRYGLSAGYEDLLRRHGLVISARDELGDARMAELPGHPFFVGSLFQPELTSDPTWVHPLIASFASAVGTHASTAQHVTT